jgi:hypothetical protein
MPYRKIVIEYLNKVFGSQQDAHKWWLNRLAPLIEKFFTITWYPFTQGQAETRDWRGAVYAFASKNGKEFLFQNIGMRKNTGRKKIYSYKYKYKIKSH